MNRPYARESHEVVVRAGATERLEIVLRQGVAQEFIYPPCLSRATTMRTVWWNAKGDVISRGSRTGVLMKKPLHVVQYFAPGRYRLELRLNEDVSVHEFEVTAAGDAPPIDLRKLPGGK